MPARDSKTALRQPTDAARFWRDPDLDGLECLRATYVRHRFAAHRHETFAIGVIEAGAQQLRHRGAQAIMPERTVCVINPDEAHTGQAATEAGWTYSMIYPSPEALAAAASMLRDRSHGMPAFEGLVFDDPPLVRQFLDCHAALANPAATPLARQSLLAGFLAALLARHGRVAPRLGPEPGQAGLLRARDYLQANYGQTVALADLARLAELSEYHFIRRFKQAFGLPPHAYQLCRRIAAAKSRLARGESIASVAAAVGFVDQSHLTNRFRAVLGVTPGQFAAGSRNLQDGARRFGA